MSPILGGLLLGYVCLLVDLVRRRATYPWQRNAQIDGLVLAPVAGFLVLVLPARGLFVLDLVLFGLVVVGSLVGALAWVGLVRLPTKPTNYRRRWLNGVADLAELFKPLAPVRGAWRWSRPLRWCLRWPRRYLGLRRLGVRGWRGARLVGQWFAPAQVERLGWPGRDLQMLVGGDRWLAERGPYATWDADVFIDTVDATGRPAADYTTDVAWPILYRLGFDEAGEDPAEFIRYATLRDPEIGIDLALKYARGPWHIPSEVFPTIFRALRRAGAEPDDLTRYLDRLAAERPRIDEYHNGWAGLAAWVEHDGAAFVAARTSVTRSRWNADDVCDRWRSWHEVGERSPDLPPALWHAAGFSVAEALELIDAGDPPDAEVLAGLAALRRSP